MKFINTITRRIFILIFIFQFICASAQQRNLQDALEIANSFTSSHTTEQGIEQQGVQKVNRAQSAQLAYISSEEQGESAHYYVFNRAEGGFVIVSGDERAYDILGYSTTGTFDLNNLPPNMEEYLELYVEELKNVDAPTSTLQKTANVETNTQLLPAPRYANIRESVAPLLGDVKWDQGSPYNLLCPKSGTTTTVTGCVATAMAQIMYYHKWPEKGHGYANYITDELKLKINADLSKSTYDWDNMTPQYSSSSTAVEKNAVATLMRDCGYAVEMDYTTNGSAASDNAVLYALPNHFSYDTDIRAVGKTTLTNDEWTELIKTELSEGRPVYHTGQSNGGGHAFVCDGYTADDFFHFNWGWGGYQNGYFRLYSLDPATGGVGAGSADGYNQSRGIIIGIQKPDAIDQVKNYDINISGMWKSSTSATTKGNDFTITIPKLSSEGNEFNGKIATALCSLDSQIVQVGTPFRSKNFAAGYYYQDCDFTFSVNNDIADGNYRLYAVYKPDDSEEWHIIHGRPYSANFLNVLIFGNKVSIKNDDSYHPDLEIETLSATNLYCNRISNIDLKIKNNGNEYTAPLKVVLKAGSFSQTLELPSATILPDVPFEVQLSEKIKKPLTTMKEPVEGTLSLYYDPSNTGSTATELLGTRSVTLNPEPAAPLLILMEQVTFEDNDNVPMNNAKLSINIKNSGGYTVNEICPWIFPKEGGTSLTRMPAVTVNLAKSEQKNLVVEGPINLPIGEYKLQVRYRKNDGSWGLFSQEKSTIIFKLTDATSGLHEAKLSPMSIAPNPAADYVSIAGIDVQQVSVCDLSGRNVLMVQSTQNTVDVSSLASGTYIMHVVDKAGKRYAHKLVKK